MNNMNTMDKEEEKKKEVEEEEWKWRKIEETMIEIIKESDLDNATELTIRSAASKRLGFDLSPYPCRLLLRHLIDSFLLSIAISSTTTTSSTSINHQQQQQQQQDQEEEEEEKDNHNHNHNHVICPPKFNPSPPIPKLICQLSDQKRVTVYNSNGKTMVSFNPKQDTIGVNLGISLTAAEWSSFRNNFLPIEEAIVKLELQARSKNVPKQNNTNTTSSLVDSAAESYHIETDITDLTNPSRPPIKRKQNDATLSGSVIASNSREEISTGGKQAAAAFISGKEFTTERKQSADNNSPQGTADPIPRKLHHKVNASFAERVIPIQTARLDGKNYNSWRRALEVFLKQSNLDYVLAEPCPSISLNPEVSCHENIIVQTAIQRWVDDDYICRHHILNSLSDSLFQWYSGKSYSARDLWEELRVTYDEDFGTRRSQINSYVHFQMSDGISILEQVQEIQKIADSIMASGTWIDEYFHVSVIISKLPPSWKDFRTRLMHVEFLPLSVLMLRLQVEEESRRWCKKQSSYEKGCIIEPKCDYRFGSWKKENKRICYSCGREGHIIKNCPNRKFDVCEKKSEKESVVRPVLTANMVWRRNE